MKKLSILLVAALMLSMCGSFAFAQEKEVLEFYHGYYHAESEWPAAKAMRDLYDAFAAKHADGPVTFKPIAVENREEIVSAKVAGGAFPDVVDVSGSVPQAAIAQGLVLDVKPFIDENKLQAAVGINYTQNDVDGHIYTVHDQLESRGIWINTAVLKEAGVEAEALTTWEGFAEAMDKVRALNNGKYAYAAGQGSGFLLTAHLAQTEEGKALLMGELTAEAIQSEIFANAFKTVAKLDQANGSEHTTNDVGNLMDDFNKNGMAAVLLNGVWNASGIATELAEDIQPAIFPGNVSISTAGGGLSIASGMSEAKTKLALEFLQYMTSEEVQSEIFLKVQANPCNSAVDINALAEKDGNPITIKLANACAMVNTAPTIVMDAANLWGGDVSAAIINAFMECAVSNTDIDARFEQLQKELIAIIS